MQYEPPLDKKTAYELRNAHTGEVAETFETRREALLAKSTLEADGDYSWRIRTLIVHKTMTFDTEEDKYSVKPKGR